MKLKEAINNPKVNVFDIINEGKHFEVYTHRKPGETEEEYQKRDYKNYQLAIRLKNKSQA